LDSSENRHIDGVRVRFDDCGKKRGITLGLSGTHRLKDEGAVWSSSYE